MTDNTNNSNSAVKKPVFRKQLPNGISAAVFENTRDGRTYRSVNLQRSCKRDGKWNRMSMYLDHEHIPFVQDALKGVWEYLNNVPPSTFADQVASEGDVEHSNDESGSESNHDESFETNAA